MKGTVVTMRILHTSDLHFGIKLCGVPLMENQRFFIEQIEDIICDYGIDAVAVAGDVFDSSVANSEAITAYNDFAVKICGKLGIKMIVIAGNHDSAARLGMTSALLENSGLYVTAYLDEMKKISIDNADIYCIPYFNASQIENAGSYENAYMIICDEIRRKADKSRVNILMAHAFVNGSRISESDKAAAVGGSNLVSKDVFGGFDYVALGHLHRFQEIGENIVYSGSPVKYSFGEAEQDKQVVIFDTNTKKREYVEIGQKRDLCVVKGTYDEVVCGENNDDYVKVVLTDRNAGLTVTDELRSRYKNLLSVVGKSGDEHETAVTSEEISHMSPTDILNMYFKEKFDYEPTKEQTELFEKAVSDVWEEKR